MRNKAQRDRLVAELKSFMSLNNMTQKAVADRINDIAKVDDDICPTSQSAISRLLNGSGAAIPPETLDQLLNRVEALLALSWPAATVRRGSR